MISRPALARWAPLCLIPLSIPATAKAQHERFPAEDWVDRVQSIRSVLSGEPPQWSPDGTEIMFASGLLGGGLWSVPAEGGFPSRMAEDIGGVPFQLARHPQWSPTGEWVSYVSDRGSDDGAPDLWLWSTVDGRDVRLTHLGARMTTTSWSPDGRWIVFTGGGAGNYDIWRVSVPDGRVERLTDDERYEIGPTWTPDARSIVYAVVDDHWVDHDVMIMSADGSGPRLMVRDTDFFDYNTSSGTPNFSPLRVSPDGSTVLFRSWRSGWINYYTVPIQGGEPRPIAPESWDQSDARWSPDGRRIAYVSNRNGTFDLRVVAESGGRPDVLVDPGMGVVRAPEWSPDGTHLSYTLQTPTEAADLFVIDVDSRESLRLTDSSPGGNAGDALIVPEKVTYPSGDLTINGYLYLPRTMRDGERLPGIVFAHGGPTGQYIDTYQTQMQFFAEQGYAVLAPNFRGGAGYGRAFAELNDGCWAHCDLDDLVAGVEYLKTLPHVDPDNMGITGTSHGGLLSMAGATFAPGVFRASIPHGGTADRIHYYHTQELRHVKQAEDEFGPLQGNEETYRYVSPQFYVKEVNTPQFVIWGEGLWPASDSSARYVAELERLYKPHRAKVYYGEDYYVSNRDNVRQMLLDMLEFFDEHLKSGRAGAIVP